VRRLVAALSEVKRLQALALEGKVLAALELADIYRVASLRELLGVICPNGLPSVGTFDCAADAYRLKELRARRGRSAFWAPTAQPQPTFPCPLASLSH
jgi:hypothetical protein